MILNQKTIDAIQQAIRMTGLYKELKEEQARKTMHAYKTETSESWLAVQAIDKKVCRAQTELFALERIILNELGVKWL